MPTLSIQGSVADNSVLESHNGNINVGDIGKRVEIETHNGNIHCRDTGEKASLKTHNGNIHANTVGEKSKLTSHNGNINVKFAPESATLKTSNGDIYENGVKRKKDKHQNSSMIFNGGGVFSGNFLGRSRIIVNGVDVTDVVNNSGSNPSLKQEEPKRYFKK